MANFYYNQNDYSWYSDSSYTTSADFSTITSGDAIIGDISNLNFINGSDLSGINFSGVTNATNTYFGSAILTGADFSNVTSMNGAFFSGAILTNAILPSDISGATFDTMDLSEADFSDVTDIAGTKFWNVDLTVANLNFSNVTDISGADFQGSNLTEVDFGTLDMSGINFVGTNLTGANFSQTTGGMGGFGYSNGQPTNLTNVIFPSDLSNINFSDSYSVLLSGGDFSNVTNMANTRIGNGSEPFLDLTGADFSNVTNMAGAAFYGVNLTDASFPANISGAYFETVNLTNVSFGTVGITNASNVRFSNDIIVSAFSFADASDYSNLSFQYARLIAASGFNNIGVYLPPDLSLMSSDAFDRTDNGVDWANGGTSIFRFDYVTDFANPSLGNTYSGLNLSNLDLRNKNFEAVTGLYQADLRNSILPSDISGIYFNSANFTGTDFSNVTNMDGVEFYSSVTGLENADFSNVTSAVGLQFTSSAYYTGTIAGTYFIDGTATDLVNGNGWWANTSAYYINGTPRYGLNEQGTGWGDDAYYIEGVQTDLDSNGSGFWNNKAYISGSENPTGWNSYYYYIDNVQTDLNSEGDGFFNDLAYIYGVLINGYFSGSTNSVELAGVEGYFINGVLTTLDFDGNGTWNGGTYLGGVLQGGGGEPSSGNVSVKIEGNAKFYGKVKFA